MNGLHHWWVVMWPQIEPNLIASLLWTPLAGLALYVHHRLLRSHLEQALYAKFELLFRRVSDQGGTAEVTINEKP